MMADERTALTPSSSTFWVLVAALKRFVEEEGKGSLPLEVLLWRMLLTQGAEPGVASESLCPASGREPTVTGGDAKTGYTP